MAIGRSKRPFHTRERQRRHVRRRVFLSVLTIALLSGVVGALLYVTRLPALSIADVRVIGAETVSSEYLRERTHAILANKQFLGLVPNRFRFAVPTEYIAEVLEEIPRVREAKVWREGNVLSITIAEHAPEMLWCGAASGSPCWYVDEEGVAYERAPDLTGETLMRFVIADADPHEGASLLSNESRATLLAIARAMDERHGFRVSRITYAADGDATLALSGGGVVLISTLNELEETYANLASILSSEEFAHLKPGNFERIDLRFGNKVFVEEEPFVATSTATATPLVE